MNHIRRCFLMIILLAAASVQAHDKRNRFNIDEAIRTSDMIFLGSVVDVNYASSSKTDSNPESLPHTFVTYQVHRLLKGNPRQANSPITLRFLGGRGTESEFMYPSNYPLFDRGDMDVIFVKRNTVSTCPLYQCATSRFRALDNMIFNERGQQVVLTPRQTVAFGKFEMRKEITTHQISQTTIQAIPMFPKSEGPSPVELPNGRQFTLDALISYLDAKIAKAFPPDVMNQLPIVASANVQIPFAIRPLREAKPPTPVSVVVRPPQAPTAEDLKEEDEYAKNGNNPVIKQ